MKTLAIVLACWSLVALVAAVIFLALFGRGAREELTRDRDADELGREVQGVGVHGGSYGRGEGARS